MNAKIFMMLLFILTQLVPIATAQELEILFEANFENAVISPEMRANGVWEVVEQNGNHFLQGIAGDEGQDLFVINGADWTDYFTDADLRIMQGVFHMDVRAVEDRCDGYRLTIDADKQSVGLYVVKQQGNNCVTVDVLEARNRLDYDWSADWTNIEITLIGDDMMVFLDNESILSGWDSNYLTGSVRFSIEPNTMLDIDNLRVRDLSDDFPENPPLTLTDYDGDPADTLKELRDLDYVSRPDEIMVQRDPLYLDGEGSWFYELLEDEQFTNVVLAADLTFMPGVESSFFDDDTSFESCGLVARIGDYDPTWGSINFVEVAFTNQGSVMAVDQLSLDVDENLLIHDVRNYDYAYPHHMIMGVIDDKLFVFVDGELVFDRLDVVSRSGTIGFMLEGITARTSCELDNAWIAYFDN